MGEGVKAGPPLPTGTAPCAPKDDRVRRREARGAVARVVDEGGRVRAAAKVEPRDVVVVARLVDRRREAPAEEGGGALRDGAEGVGDRPHTRTAPASFPSPPLTAGAKRESGVQPRQRVVPEGSCATNDSVPLAPGAWPVMRALLDVSVV